MEKITFMPDGEEAAVDFYVLEQTTIGGVNYILVTDAEEEEDGEAYILKAFPGADDHEQVYRMVEDEDELAAVAGVFENMLDDIDLI
ncbi:MAG: DUF1292 domain-containing protein [Lachnospiraceae bacterium]|nr:DUF1292 domain-containing protein [Lachnospiraceae bacterium]MDE7273506.1 DUF1292 domain-containing protein [Lachnospiraceae bacterium]